MQALGRDADGDIDKSLIPRAILAWYDGFSDEETTSSDNES